MSAQTETAILGGGCFWCLEAVFEQLKGVAKVESGYTGGAAPNPTYEAVCGGKTGHAEVIRVTFDPAVISFRELLEVFFVIHDPTTLNRQGADVGTQYRSAIFYTSEEQRHTTGEVIQELTNAKTFANPIVTKVELAQEFFKAEEYHQGYYRANPDRGYCQMVVSPKVAKARAAFAPKLK
ncbi:peptide-methionine (S)-S-oxide reductase MsrA [Gemmata sp. JC717]|uniref:peptide-methionine (S)-S-oxide reductase MsrA n=1 Tax=Gemmata algarum TaxID=2975278 RepID=UPI0021BB9D3D|nr:peptide-methionine (S)-S-oxide reductase MsrA [Gemmata algarum]MDY3552813.1 peptide-methionine (S)-S-oxide reductase MsrA [Gemmata algarum]